MKKVLILLTICFVLFGCAKEKEEPKISSDIAYAGVNNYCHDNYDWSVADENPDIMYVKMGEETDTEYEVIFRSYTGAFINFYVNKEDGKTRIIENSPVSNETNELVSINILDYIKE